MKATCPNEPEHNVFFTTAHVVEEWKVDREGNFIMVCGTLETVHGPHPDNVWECAICGCHAEVE